MHQIDSPGRRPCHRRRIRSSGSTLLAAFLVVAPVHAQLHEDSASSQQQTGLPGIVLSDMRTSLRLALRAYSAPFHWDGKDWLIAGGGCALTGLSSAADVSLRDALMRSHSSAAGHAADAGIAYGDGLNVAIGVAGLYTVGLLVREPWLRETVMLAGTATLVSASISTVTKFIVGRARPYTGSGNHFFKPLAFSEDHVSFPSGHTVVAFSVSSVLAERIGNPWATAGLYALASLTGAGRMYRDGHWLSDVVPAALFASVIGRSMVQWFESDKGEASSSLDLLPGPSSLTLVWRFNLTSDR